MKLDRSQAAYALLLFLLSVPSLAHAQSNGATVTGSVAYLERIALPADADIDVQLLDTTIADVAAQTVAESLINAEGRQVPVPFTLTYDPAQIVPAHRYSVRATIRSGDGMLMFSTTQAYPVLTHGAPSKVSLILHRVGHGTKPGATTKKPVASSESAPAATTPAPAVEQPSEARAPVATPENRAPAMSQGSSERAPATEQGSQPPAPLSAARAVIQEASPPTPSTAAPAEPSAVTTPEVSPSTELKANTGPASSTVQPTKESTPASHVAPATTPAESGLSRPSEAQTAAPLEPAPAPAESKPPEPPASLPEAPSASKRAEMAAIAPETVEEAPEGASTSRPERPAPNKALTPLADTQWRLIELSGQQVIITPPQKPMTLAFSPEGRRIAGSAGCNSYLGTFTDNHGLLHLSPGSMTMLFCADPAGSREKKFVAMLRAADGYRINGEILLLTSNGKTVAKFKTNPPL